MQGAGKRTASRWAGIASGRKTYGNTGLGKLLTRIGRLSCKGTRILFIAIRYHINNQMTGERQQKHAGSISEQRATAGGMGKAMNIHRGHVHICM